MDVLHKPPNMTPEAIQKIPNHIWRMIFDKCKEDHHEDLEDNNISMLRFCAYTVPLLLCQVCSTWRKIVIGYPQLWCNIAVEFHRAGPLFPAKELIYLAMERAQNIGINFHITNCHMSRVPVISLEEGWSHPRNETIYPILQQLPRIKFINLDVADLFHLHSTTPGREDMASIAIRGFPLLQRLQLFVESRICPDTHVAASMMNFWNFCPELKEVEFKGFSAAKTPCSICPTIFPFSKLTSLVLVDCKVTFSEFLYLLAATSLLENCKIRHITGNYKSFIQNYTAPPISLPHLKCLDLEGPDVSFELERRTWPSLSNVISLLKCPSLISLHLRVDHYWDMAGFRAFIKNSAGCRILEFMFNAMQANDVARLDCLRLLPHLEVFVLCASPDSMSADGYSEVIPLALPFFARMLQKDKQNGRFLICPNLKSISIDDHYFSRNQAWSVWTTLTPFADMCQARWSNGKGALKTAGIRKANPYSHGQIQLTSSNSFHEQIRLLILKKMGLNIEIDNYPEDLDAVICR